MSENALGGWRNLSILLLAFGCSFAMGQPAAWAESEASFAVGDSQATWGGWSSEARSCARSEAQWGTSGSEASWGGSSEASSQAGSESGYGGQLARYGGRRGYWRHYYRGGSANTYDASGYDRSQSSAMQRLKREQQEEQSHQADLAKMPDSAFVHSYGAATPGGVVDAYRRKNYGGYGQGRGYGNTSDYGRLGGQSSAYGGTDAYSGRQRDTLQR